MATDCSASFLSQLWSGNAIICNSTFRNYEAAQAVKQQVDTLQNVQTNYAGQTDVIAAAEASTAAAIAAAPGDTQDAIDSVLNSCAGDPLSCSDCDGINLSLFGGGCLSWTWIYIALAIVAGLILLFILTDLKQIF